MEDTNQIFIPESFARLYGDERGRLCASRSLVEDRYELCEDLAGMMVDQCQLIHFRDGVNEAEILARCLKGLLTPPCAVDEAEAQWVVTRTAELLNWQAIE